MRHLTVVAYGRAVQRLQEHTMSTPNLRAGDMTNEQMEDWGPLAMPLAAPLGDAMATHGKSMFETADGTISTGTWQCGPGHSRWDFVNNGEFIHVLSGSMTCTEDDGTTTEVTPGSTVVFPKGWAGTWTIHETLRKVYVLFS
jgi:uncharacterized protein